MRRRCGPAGTARTRTGPASSSTSSTSTATIAGQWIPYRLDAAGKDAFGVSLSDEWQAWSEELAAELETLDATLAVHGPITEPERLTHDARWGWHPKVSPDGSVLVYARSDGRSDIQLRVDSPEGGNARQLMRTNGLATSAWTPAGELLLSQREMEGPYRSYGDLYLGRLDGSQERITHGARLSDPTVYPDGRRALAVQHGDGSNGLVTVQLDDGSVQDWVAPDPDVHWAFPRISPDGRWVAATRWEAGRSDVVVLDAASGRLVERVTDDRAVDLAPEWSADGRWLVWASDRSGIANILAASIDASGAAGEIRMLTNLRTGATFPSVDPADGWLYFSGYHVDGWDVERVPFAPETAPMAPPLDPRFAPRARRVVEEADGEIRAYAPGESLRPTYWEISTRDAVVFPARTTGDGFFLRRREALGPAIGMQTTGRDLVGRHSYSVYGRIHVDRPKLDAGFGYTFAGLGNPHFSVSAVQRYDDDGHLAAGTTPDTLFVLATERDLEASVRVFVPRWRHDLSAVLGAGIVFESRELLGRDLESTNAYRLGRPTSRAGELRASVSFVSSRAHSFQMGLTRGVSLFVQGRQRTDLQLPDSLVSVAGADRSFTDVLGRARLGVPLWSTGRTTHVLALQAAAGSASGPGVGVSHFDVGGASGQSESVTGAELFGGNFLFFPLRGYPRSTRFGRHAWAASAEYRFPIAILNRGVGAWPLHFDRVVGSLFLDAGNAWGPDLSPSGFMNPMRSPLWSGGAEVTTQVLALFSTTTRLRTGVAFPFQGGRNPMVYLRVGLPF